MKTRGRFIAILFTVSLLLSACNTGIDPREHMEDIYTIALDSIMDKDKALNSEMEFIAIDMSNFKHVDQKQKEDILTFFKDKYGVDVMDATFEELKEKGYYNPNTSALSGVLLKMEKVEITFTNNVSFEGSKYRSGTGAVGVAGTIHFKNDHWKIKELKKIWVS